MKFFVITKRHFIVFLLIIFCVVSVVIVNVTKQGFTFQPIKNIAVVIDAGHGGIDGGCVGKSTGVYESELNLIYAKNLSNQLNNMGVSTYLTRKDNNGLYNSNATNLKKSDMQKRKEIIDKVNPTIIVSIHMNSFPSSSVSGAQVFYKKDNESGKALATCIQNQLNICFSNTKKTAKIGDYYMVNCTNLPAVLIECGYLSNVSEEKLLQNKEYQNKFCYIVCCGILDFFNKK